MKARGEYIACKKDQVMGARVYVAEKSFDGTMELGQTSSFTALFHQILLILQAEIPLQIFKR